MDLALAAVRIGWGIDGLQPGEASATGSDWKSEALGVELLKASSGKGSDLSRDWDSQVVE